MNLNTISLPFVVAFGYESLKRLINSFVLTPNLSSLSAIT
jgi:hypothetical protein